MDPDRRRALRAAGTGLLAALAGCAGGIGSEPTASPSPTASPTPTPEPDADGDGVPDADDDYPDDDRRSRTLASREEAMTLEKGVWQAFALTYDQQGILDYEMSVEAGPAIDVIVLPRDRLSAFRNRESVDFYPSVTRFDVDAASVDAILPKGRYVLVVDNTSRGRADPGDTEPTTAEVQFAFEQAV